MLTVEAKEWRHKTPSDYWIILHIIRKPNSIIDLSFSQNIPSLRKQTTFSDAITGFSAKWRLRNKSKNSILMTRHYPDLGSASDWLKEIPHAARSIRSTIHIWVVKLLQYGVYALISHTYLCGETSGDVAKCRLFSRNIPSWKHVFLYTEFPPSKHLHVIRQFKDMNGRFILHTYFTEKFPSIKRYFV